MEQFSERDHHYMSRALALAARGRYTVGANPMVGCVIVRDEEIVAENYHHRIGSPHAEPLALAAAADAAHGATVYVTLEPCVHQGRTPPCVPSLIEAKVKRVVIAMSDPDPRVNGQGIAELRAAGVQVEHGLLAQQAQALNCGFVSRIKRGRPWLRIKSAISLDGHIALACGASSWISGEAARRDVQFWRAQSTALLTSSRTVLADNPQLNVRLDSEALDIKGAVRQPLRVVLDRKLTTSPSAKIYNSDAPTIVVCDNTADKELMAQFEQKGVEILTVQAIKSRAILVELLETLAAQYEINEIQVEAGGVLFGAIVEADLCDELLLYLAPCILGAGSQGLARFDNVVRTMDERINFSYKEVKNIGDDIRIIAQPCRQ
ncbi:MAG: bifunctional diaminohydroxyphosphoribosylaminopyrimidine deaminase/5-amino-6-(5-phosphoribosylamino)uracil reductase RibD [Chromatiales bacterium]|nr:bifunctional diaminohydroxyphosphoribosylaminopyrimidine deaminase/5-amino-6-(5-phosphoribosylamino)uracil reductase RibD [Chromatiales bacterium]